MFIIWRLFISHVLTEHNVFRFYRRHWTKHLHFLVPNVFAFCRVRLFHCHDRQNLHQMILNDISSMKINSSYTVTTQTSSPAVATHLTQLEQSNNLSHRTKASTASAIHFSHFQRQSTHPPQQIFICVVSSSPRRRRRCTCAVINLQPIDYYSSKCKLLIIPSNSKVVDKQLGTNTSELVCTAAIEPLEQWPLLNCRRWTGVLPWRATNPSK